MQDIHLIGGGGSGGRIFGGGGGERRLRPHHHHAQALKCPRCDSLNTKFCYYNNYNLSQPRHFCRSCNRYWTKGGVLRNVPVGGGCRKSKRSRPKPPPSSKASSRSSSSESSSLTAAATTTAAPPPPSDPRFFLPQPNANPNPDPNPNVGTGGELIDPRPSLSSSEAPIFAEIGSFTSLITDPAILCFNASSDSPPAPDQSVRNNQNWNLLQKMANSVVGDQEPKVQEIAGGIFDPMVQIELPGAQNRSSSTGLFPPFDWETSGEHNNIFDFSGAVDQGYWTENQWNTDHPLYLP